ncbi:hypothetical protein QE372_004788 [Agrobacterium pusense]|uniref:hypothetical protein n=1 Tax=Agrobacterium pusense TaxID=648995 RepID=UPI002859B415|nr:hypothetical protein [Agrobacterium pusense]MDR6192454.1 hypothetical protein [Agrobacterium pusense]
MSLRIENSGEPRWGFEAIRVKALAEDEDNPAADQLYVPGRSILIRSFVLWKQGNPAYISPVETALVIDSKHPFLHRNAPL